MDDPEITNPLAKQLHERKDAEDAQTGKNLLEKDFIRKGQAEALDQLKGIDSEIAEYVRTYTAQRPATAPHLRHVPNRVIADMKFAVTFELIQRLGESQLRVIVGLQPGAAVMMAEIPDVETTEWWFQAYMDDGGFVWRDGQGRKFNNSQIVNSAMRALEKLL